MFKESGKTRGNRKGRFTFETMERRELMTANLGMAMEPIEVAPVAAVASPTVSARYELTYANNDTMASASSIGTVATSVTYNGSVGGTDPRDYWKFRVANSGTATIQLAGLSRDVDIQILDSSGRVFASGTNGGTSSESITVNLQAGVDYFIKVYPYGSGGVSNYQLTINPPITINPPSDNTPAGARPIGTVANSVTYGNSVGGADPVDYWKFRVANSGATTIQLAGLSRDVDIRILDPRSGRVLASGTNGGTSSESLTVDLQAGVDYLIEVFPYGSGGVSNYQLTINAPNDDTMAGARPIGTVATSVTYSDSVGGADPADYRKFRVANSGATTIQLAGLSRDVDIQILDSSGRVLASGTNGGTSSESLTVNLQAGVDYFIKVFPYGSGGVSNYQLSINAPRPLSDDTMAGARPIGSVYNTTRTMYGSVGGSDPIDYFSFTHGPSSGTGTATRQVHINLTGLTADLDLQVVDSSGNIVGRSFRDGTTSESLTLSLITGRQYFIRVYPYGSVASNYALTVSS